MAVSNNGQADENEYAQATKVVVDDAMRIDILGPNVCKVLKEHSPTSEQLKTIFTTAIGSDTNVQRAIAKVVDGHATTKKGEGLTKIQAIAVTAVVTLVVTLVGAALWNGFVSQLGKS